MAEVFPLASVKFQTRVRVKVAPHALVVVSLTTFKLAVPQASVACGAKANAFAKAAASPQAIVASKAKAGVVIDGAVTSNTVT